MTSLREHADPGYQVVDIATGPADPIRSRYVLAYRAGVGVVGLGTADEAREVGPAALPPAVLVPADWTFARLVESNAVTLLDLAGPGVLLVDGERPVAVLPLESIRGYLTATGPAVSTRILGEGDAAADTMLAGDYQVARARVVCAEPGCGYVNTLDFFDRYRPPECVNPHPPRHPLRVHR